MPSQSDNTTVAQGDAEIRETHIEITSRVGKAINIYEVSLSMG